MIVTFEAWLKRNPKYIPRGYGKDSALIPYRELPPIVLSPIVYGLWKEKYEEKIGNLSDFLGILQGRFIEGSRYDTMQRELKERGVITKTVGGGVRDLGLYGFHYDTKRIPQNMDITDYLISKHPMSGLIAGHPVDGVILKIDLSWGVSYALNWKGWWFPPGIFVFNIDKCSFMNWIEDTFTLK